MAVQTAANQRFRPGKLDVLIAVVAVTLDVLLFSDIVAKPVGGASRTASTTILGYALIGFILLLWRTRFPIVVFLLLCVHATMLSLFVDYGPILLVCVALATVAARFDARIVGLSLLIALIPIAGWTYFNYSRSPEPLDRTTIALIATAHFVILLVATGIGRWQHAVLERRAAAASAAVAAERLRLAQELQGIVADTVLQMVRHTRNARRFMSSDSHRAEAALSLVEDAGTQAREELGRLLDVLRIGNLTPRPVSHGAAYAGLDDLENFVQRMRSKGAQISLKSVGNRGQLDPSVGLAAYRVVQDTLTKIEGHTGTGASVAIMLNWGEELLVLTIEHSGRGAGGRNLQSLSEPDLLGLKERVRVAGGTLDTEAMPNGVRVSATLPVVQLERVGRTAKAPGS